MHSDLKKIIAETFSYLLSPISIAFFCIIILSFYQRSSPTALIIYNFFISSFFLCIFPLITIFYYYRKGTIDLWVSKRSDRTRLYLIAMIGYFVYCLISYIIGYHTFFVFSVAYFFVTIAMVISNLFTKLSSHTAGLTGPVTALVYMYGVNALILFLLLPLVFWARKTLHAHTYFQLVLGAVQSFIVTLGVYFVLY